MASRSLGTLTLDLIAKIGGFESGMDRAARVADRKGREISAAAKKRAAETQKAWEGVGDFIGKVFAGITVGAVFQKFIAETKGAEQEQAQLAAVLRSTGESAGWSQEKLNDMADAMERSSTFSAGDINTAQTRLLAYTGIVGEQVPQAMQAVLDMAARTGMTLEQSAETIGKALDVPSKGLTALSKQGFRFTEDQKKLAERLEATGRTAEAQGIILDALQSSYGGAAAAARDTFGGAVSALQNNINGLLTGDTGSMAKLKGSVESLNSTLSSEQTKASFQLMVGWMADVSTFAIRGAADIITFVNSANKLAAIKNFAQISILRLQAGSQANSMVVLNAELEKFQALAEQGDKAAVARVGSIRDQMSTLMRESSGTADALKVLAGEVVPTPEASTATAIPAALTGGRPRAGDLGDDETKKAKQKWTDYAQTVKQSLASMFEDTDTVKRQKVLDQLKALNELAGAGMDPQIVAQTRAALGDVGPEIPEELLRARKEQLDALKALLDATPSAELERQRKDMELLAQAYQDGALGIVGSAEAIERFNEAAQTRLGTLPEQWKKDTDEMDEFTRQAARNIQDSLGRSTKALLTGDFKSIGNLWMQTLQEMAAQAAAAQLGKLLFGDFAKTGNLGGLFGQGLTSLGGLFSGGGSSLAAATAADVGAAGGGLMFLAGGGYTGAGGKFEPKGVVHGGEYVINADSTRKLGLGFLDRLNGYAAGGFVGNAGPAGAMSGRGPLTVQVQIDGTVEKGLIRQYVSAGVQEGIRQYDAQLSAQGVK